MGRVNKRTGGSNNVDVFPQLKSRACPGELVDAMGYMNEKQKDAVRTMGFAQILHLTTHKVPAQLAYWVLDHFDASSSELVMDNGRSISVDPDDVYSVFGFPKGGTLIQTRRRSDVCSKEETWYNQFDKERGRGRIVMNDVRVKMMNDNDGGDMFKMNFLVLVTASLVENAVNGYISPHLMNYMDKLDTIADLDWCEYVVRSLIEHKVIWDKNKSNYFGGPTLFITAMYVDRVVHQNQRDVARDFPSIKGWTYTIMRKRQQNEIKSGRFGAGRICPRFEVGTLQEEQEVNPAHNVAHLNRRPNNAKDVLDEFTEEYKTKSKLLADTIVKLITLLDRAPKEVSDSARFKSMVDGAQHLVGNKFGSTESISVTQEARNEDDFWRNPECISIIEGIENAILKRAEFNSRDDDIPSFSLGLTQEFGQENVRYVGENEDEHLSEELLKRKPDENIEVANDKVVVAASKHQMFKRNANNNKVNEALTSPYMERAINASEKVDKREKELFFWLVYKKHQDNEEVVFSDNKTNLRRKEMRTLRAEVWISSSVVDVWSIVLNFKKDLRAKTSQCRFFTTTDPCCIPIANPPKEWATDRCKENFSKKLEEEISNSVIHSLDKIDMFFFPILKDKHYYVVCFDVVYFEACIIDNSDAQDSVDIRFKYGNTPFFLQDVFSKYLHDAGINEKSVGINRACITRLKMPWRDAKNTRDCGVYAMRHMETYMGGGVEGWNCGIKRMNGAQMRCMRLKYCAAILTAENNIHKDDIIKSARRVYSSVIAKRPVSVNDLFKEKI
ncbi:hypothetical protein C2S52_021627 [Perilla frutescens var. hirtella]|nr:hypothetical protein C2S52_021627 [Perilla frutescens var. hirtella]